MVTTFDDGYALLIGVGECKDKSWSLPVTVKDIQALYQILIAPELCGYPEENIQLLHDKTATRTNILDSLSWLKNKAHQNPNCTVLIYYSGHGWLDKDTGNYYLIPHDTDSKKEEFAGSALAAEVFTKAIQQIESQRVLVVIDCCHAQGMAATKGEPIAVKIPGRFAETATAKSLIHALSQGKGRAIFTSCTGNEKSWMRKDNLMSIYTYHLIQALQGAGNSPDDTVVRLSNLMNYLAKTVPDSAASEFGITQTPNFDISNEDFAVAIALLRGGKGLPPGGWDAVKDEAAQKIRQVVQAGRDVIGVEGSGNVAISGGAIHNTNSQDTYTTNNQGSTTYQNPVYNQQGSTTYQVEGETVYTTQGGKMYNSQGGEIHIGDRIYNPPPEKPKATFEKLIRGIAKKFTYLEQIPPFDADDIWKMVRDGNGEGFEPLDLKVFQLVLSYCCYYYNHRITPMKDYQNCGEMDYLHQARQLSQTVRLTQSNSPLSSIIKSRELADIIRTME
ncbi:caspase family protein [Laspinema olomoucense]|uniref:Caspase family protein n=1 Tax=Laspinema olomoucense D3b TaxID=2953688 RepID=A0ABT2NAE6_9CYAN|nr:caspase family protein [Laspinema sp. D3b]MCT7979678.1 caspase family protein [Laspinema sp. D3b]